MSVSNERLQDDKLSAKVDAKDDKMLITYDLRLVAAMWAPP
ncbi:hypothetical protein [Bradyrhizobium sp. LMG 9283]